MGAGKRTLAENLFTLQNMASAGYRGRLAPSPTGLLHVGHARTFSIAARRASQHQGTLALRNEDLDSLRCRPEFVSAMLEDLHWLGIHWQEGPDIGGPFGPYSQSERRQFYFHHWRRLRDDGLIYPCTCSRKEVAESASAPHEGSPGEVQEGNEPIYSGRCRSRADNRIDPAGINWRFRVPDGEEIQCADIGQGRQSLTAGRDFGDFLVWSRDDIPAYQLAVVTDDAAMQITEVVRGADLLKSTARQILLYRALGLTVPAFYHCDLVRDQGGIRLAKRHDSLSVRSLRQRGFSPSEVLHFGTE